MSSDSSATRFALRSTRSALPMALLRAREAVMSRFRPLLDSHGINEQQWRVIRVLSEGGPLDATEVAARANILAPSLTRMIRALTERGLVHRGNDASDGRRVILRVTSAGQQLIDTVSPLAHAIYVNIDQEVGQERVAELIAMLEALTATLNGSDAPAGGAAGEPSAEG